MSVTATAGSACGIKAYASRLLTTITGNAATVNAGTAAYFLHLYASLALNSAKWSGNGYTRYGGPWVGNYDVGGHVTPPLFGPVYTNILDAEITP